MRLVRHALGRRDFLARRRTETARRGRQVGAGLVLLSVVVGVVLALLDRSSARIGFGASRVERAELLVKQLAFEAYPAWRADHPGAACPRRLSDLDAYRTQEGEVDVDPWGRRLELRCGPDLPGGADGVWVRSAGEDGRFGTGDDITSSP